MTLFLKSQGVFSNSGPDTQKIYLMGVQEKQLIPNRN